MPSPMLVQLAPRIPDEWSLQVGSVWAGILADHAVHPGDVLVEIGPGFADKIGLGLAKLGFAGRLYIVEPNGRALAWATSRYRDLLPRAEIVAVQAPIATASRHLPDHVDAVVMNHVFDDFVLFSALDEQARDRVFGAIRADCPSPPETRKTWEELIRDRRRCHALAHDVLSAVDGFLAHVRPRLFGASQYPSGFLMANGLERVDRLGADLLTQLSARIGAMSQDDRAALLRREQDPDRWLIRDGSLTRGDGDGRS